LHHPQHLKRIYFIIPPQESTIPKVRKNYVDIFFALIYIPNQKEDLFKGGNPMKTIRLEDMNWPDIQVAIEKGFTTVVIGVGSTEQHGPHLPLKTDALIGDALAYGVAQQLGNALHAPTIRVGCSEHHLAFPGTISLHASTLKAIIIDYVESLAKHGFKNIILIPSHGGNFQTVKDAICELNETFKDLRIIGYTDLKSFMDFLIKSSKAFSVTEEEAGAHAGETETSFLLALEKELVHKDRFTAGYLGPLGDREIKTIFEKGMPSLTENGTLGDPSKATQEKGKIYLEKTVCFLVKEIKKQL
jgi:creatinine amidohydrolase